MCDLCSVVLIKVCEFLLLMGENVGEIMLMSSILLLALPDISVTKWRNNRYKTLVLLISVLLSLFGTVIQISEDELISNGACVLVFVVAVVVYLINELLKKITRKKEA